MQSWIYTHEKEIEGTVSSDFDVTSFKHVMLFWTISAFDKKTGAWLLVYTYVHSAYI